MALEIVRRQTTNQRLKFVTTVLLTYNTYFTKILFHMRSHQKVLRLNS